MSQYPQDLANVAIYLRKSRADLDAEERGEGETLSKHRQELLTLAKRNGYAIDAIYEELVSGERIVDRPEMQKLLHDVAGGSYSAVLVVDIDRLGRGNKIDQGIIQEAFRDSKTMIITPRKAYDLTDELDDEYVDFESFLAHRELKIITRRLQRGKRMSVANGKSISSKPPFGYQRVNQKLVPDPETAPIVQRIFAWAAQGWGRVRICHALDDLGIPTPRGNAHWGHHTIKHILTNPAYIGHLRWDFIRRKKQEGRLKKALQPDEIQTWSRAAHEPLVSEDVFNQVQTLQHRHLPLGSKKTLMNPLAGMVFCSVCGRALNRVPKKFGEPLLQCRSYQCPTRGARLVDVEQAVLHALESMLPELHKTAQDRVLQDKGILSIDRDIRALEKAILTAEQQRARLHDLLEQGTYDLDTFLDRSRVLGQRIDALRAQLKDRERMLMIANKVSPSAQTIHEVLEVYRHTDDIDQKNKILRSVIKKITYRRDPEWKEVGQLTVEITLI